MFIRSSHVFLFLILQTAYLFSKFIPTISSTIVVHHSMLPKRERPRTPWPRFDQSEALFRSLWNPHWERCIEPRAESQTEQARCTSLSCRQLDRLWARLNLNRRKSIVFELWDSRYIVGRDDHVFGTDITVKGNAFESCIYSFRLYLLPCKKTRYITCACDPISHVCFYIEVFQFFPYVSTF